MRAIVVGGGIGGLSAAIALRGLGHEVAVFERSRVLGEVGAGLAIWANTVRVLRQLGVADAVLAAACRSGAPSSAPGAGRS
jgi:2-polyprenyl-6-methoxyphenol hydroxylase-like FAD-dependent oxidoreductase